VDFGDFISQELCELGKHKSKIVCVHAKEAYEGMEVYLRSFLMFMIDEVSGLLHGPAIVPWEKEALICNE
jgi:hypothetical protein